MNAPWVIDLDTLELAPDCEMCGRQTCVNYRTCRGELAALVERTARRAFRDGDREGSRS